MPKQPPVLALGLDAMSPQLLERWVAQGALPTLAKLFKEGTYARQANTSLYRVENSWLTLLQGCNPEQGKEWGHQDYHAGDYEVKERAAYGFNLYPPFFALGDARRVAVFDVPLTAVVPDVNGVQLVGWGTEVNQILRQSSPPGLMADLIARHGRHPLYDTIANADDGSETLSYRIPSVYDVGAMRAIRDKLVQAVEQRTRIIADLMRRERWDLLMAVYGEIHTAGHLFWHLEQERVAVGRAGTDTESGFIREVAQAIDRGVAELLQGLAPDTQLFVFSPHGMQGNSLDLHSMLFLPELLYRWNFGQAALAQGKPGPVAEPARMDYSRHWREEVWDLRTPHGNDVLESPFEQEKRQDALDWDPGNWYRKRWPQMRAFVLPGYSEGLIRVNVTGRDGPVGVAPEQFGAVCDELEQVARALVDGRTGQPMVKDVVRVRATPDADAADRSAADLMVVWRDDVSTDLAEHPQFGRIGPAPFFRTGGHSTEGFVLARGPGFAPAARLPAITTPDVTATLLAAVGVDLPPHVEGRPIGAAQP